MRTCVFMVVVAGAAWWVMVEPPVPHLELDPWWAHGDPKPEDTSIRKFTINISQEVFMLGLIVVILVLHIILHLLYLIYFIIIFLCRLWMT